MSTDSQPPCRTAQALLSTITQPLQAGRKSLEKCFYPFDGISKIFPREKVREVILCECGKCGLHRSFVDGQSHHESYVNKIVEKAICLFALMVDLGHPVFIVRFMQMGDYVTSEFVSLLTFDTLTQKYWPKYQKYSRLFSEDLAAKFETRKYRFFVPEIDATYQEYHEDRVLPFINESPKDSDEDGNISSQGTNGTVYRLEIPTYYRKNLAGGEDIQVFARKEFKSKKGRPFWLEVDNMSRVADLFNKKHVVRMLKAYKRGKIYNILLPYAKTDLEHLLRETNFRQGPLEVNHLWGQMLGIIKALRDMSEGIYQFEGDRERWIGYHFDLKPANVLVFHDGTWAIADFGQASFTEIRDKYGNSLSAIEMTNNVGTDAYAAPEIEDLNAKAGPQYDVWSMGCILLEVTVHLVRGPEGLRGPGGLDKLRRTTPPGSRGYDMRLWQRDGKHIVVKPEIEKFMENLTKSQDPNTRSRQFLEKIMVLIKGMLTPDTNKRRESNGIARDLESVLAKYRDVQSDVAPPQPEPGEFEIGVNFLRKKRYWHYEMGQIEGAKIFLFEKKDRLRIIVQKRRPGEMINDRYSFNRQETVFIPIYAFDLRMHEFTSYRHFCISSVRQPISPTTDTRRASNYSRTVEDPIFESLEFAVSPDETGEPYNAISAQSACTGQEVMCNRSFRLKELILEPYVSFANRIRHGAKHYIKKVKASNAQIWRETRQTTTLQAQNVEIGKSRIVVFMNEDNKILILRIQKEMQATMHDHDSRTIKFKPTDSTAVDRFDGHILDQTLAVHDQESNGAYAGIPCDSSMLAKQEDEHSERYRSVRLAFASPEDCKLFFEIYKGEKADHTYERHVVEGRRPRIP